MVTLSVFSASTAQCNLRPWGPMFALGLSVGALASCGGAPSVELSETSSLHIDALTAAGPLSPVSASNLCLKPDGNPRNGTTVRLVDCSAGSAQDWSYDAQTGLVSLAGSQLCLDVADGVNSKGTPLQLWSCDKNNGNQQFDAAGSGFQWRKTNKCLGLGGGIKKDAPLQILTCSSKAASQAWRAIAGGAQATPAVGAPGAPAQQAPNANNGANAARVDFGPNVLVFDSGMSMNEIQSKLNDVYSKQLGNHFGPERFAYLFKPGHYNLDVKLGFGMTAAGLGASPDDVAINGAVRVKGEFLPDNNATQNFWRGAENLSVTPTQDNGALVWAVSQGTSFRRIHVRGNMNLSDNGWSSGGFVADTKVDGTLDSGSQQQFLTRNTSFNRWNGSNWNLVFVGDKNAPSGEWPSAPYSVQPTTPIIREKPYLAVNDAGAFVVRYPQAKRDSSGVSWDNGGSKDQELPISSFYIAKSNQDNADSLNAALGRGLHILFTPGVYNLNQTLKVTRPNTTLLGLGIATLRAAQGSAVITAADVDGITVSGLMIDAGPTNSASLLVLGDRNSANDHSANPTALHDISCRVGGAGKASTTACITVNSRNVILDNTWLWRADHGDGAGWWDNPSLNGIVVNGSDVTAYALFSEHFQNYQTVWNGERGATYMYQSEFPYDAPDQNAWQHDGVNGWASYKVASQVTQHTALGLGMYGFFHNSVKVDSALESPNVPGVAPHHIVTVWLGQADGSEVTHLINGWGDPANSANRVIRSPW